MIDIKQNTVTQILYCDSRMYVSKLLNNNILIYKTKKSIQILNLLNNKSTTLFHSNYDDDYSGIKYVMDLEI